MLCKIAGLLTEVPDAGGLASRCRDYLWEQPEAPQITVFPELYRLDRYGPRVGENTVAYMESAYQFYKKLVDFDGFYLHASAVVVDGYAYLFSGNPGMGKSTHAKQWQAVFGSRAVVINDDKPALRLVDGCWFAFGTPWCGKDGINCNASAPVAGVCFLKKAPRNKIRRLSPRESMEKILSQTIYKFDTAGELDRFLVHLDRFLEQIPVFELENLPEPGAARLSYQTMRPNREETEI